MADEIVNRDELYTQLRQIFPNHSRADIYNVIEEVQGEEDNFTPVFVNRCIDLLVQIKPQDRTPEHSKNTDGEDLSPNQRRVMTELSQMFPDRSKQCIVKTVKHPDNFTPTLSYPVLLQRCLDALLAATDDISLIAEVEQIESLITKEKIPTVNIKTKSGTTRTPPAATVTYNSANNDNLVNNDNSVNNDKTQLDLPEGITTVNNDNKRLPEDNTTVYDKHEAKEPDKYKRQMNERVDNDKASGIPWVLNERPPRLFTETEEGDKTAVNQRTQETHHQFKMVIDKSGVLNERPPQLLTETEEGNRTPATHHQFQMVIQSHPSFGYKVSTPKSSRSIEDIPSSSPLKLEKNNNFKSTIPVDEVKNESFKVHRGTSQVSPNSDNESEKIKRTESKEKSVRFKVHSGDKVSLTADIDSEKVKRKNSITPDKRPVDVERSDTLCYNTPVRENIGDSFKVHRGSKVSPTADSDSEKVTVIDSSPELDDSLQTTLREKFKCILDKENDKLKAVIKLEGERSLSSPKDKVDKKLHVEGVAGKLHDRNGNSFTGYRTSHQIDRQLSDPINERKRRYVLMDLDSDSDSDEGGIVGENKHEEDEALPDISYRMKDRDRLYLSPVRRWQHDKNRGPTAATVYTHSPTSRNTSYGAPTNLSPFSQYRDKNRPVDRGYHGAYNNGLPDRLSNTRFVALGQGDNGSSSLTHDNASSSGTDALPGTSDRDKRPTVLIESTCKITYSQDLFPNSGANNEGEMMQHTPGTSIPSLLPHIPGISNSGLDNIPGVTHIPGFSNKQDFTNPQFNAGMTRNAAEVTAFPVHVVKQPSGAKNKDGKEFTTGSEYHHLGNQPPTLPKQSTPAPVTQPAMSPTLDDQSSATKAGKSATKGGKSTVQYHDKTTAKQRLDVVDNLVPKATTKVERAAPKHAVASSSTSAPKAAVESTSTLAPVKPGTSKSAVASTSTSAPDKHVKHVTFKEDNVKHVTFKEDNVKRVISKEDKTKKAEPKGKHLVNKGAKGVKGYRNKVPKVNKVERDDKEGIHMGQNRIGDEASEHQWTDSESSSIDSEGSSIDDDLVEYGSDFEDDVQVTGFDREVEIMEEGRQNRPIHVDNIDIAGVGQGQHGAERPPLGLLEMKNEVLKFFPDVEPIYLENLCRGYKGDMALNNIFDFLFENEYPKKEKNKDVQAAEKTKVFVDFFKDNQAKSLRLGQNVMKFRDYIIQSEKLLFSKFPQISVESIRLVRRHFDDSHALTYRALHDVLKQAMDIVNKGNKEGKNMKLSGLKFEAELEKDSSKTSKIAVSILKNKRMGRYMLSDPIIPELQAEIDFVDQKMREMATEEDHEFAKLLNEQEYEEQGQGIECGCCFGEIPFDNMVQCLDGHLFCEDCLRQYAKESVFGQGKAQLSCMTDGCTSAFPKNQLEKALPEEVLMRYEDRVTEESLNLADLGDLVRCPHCDFAAIMDPADRVFTCMNPKCRKETCRLCKEDWSEHFGKKCEEIEKKDEVKLRLEYEEKMTKAKVRTCHRCKAQFTKEDGCNKMTCRCGAKMCYICRQPNIEYKHFCQHPRDPGKICQQCKACSLWTNPEEDDNRAIAEIQREAAEVRKTKGYTEEKVVGVPEGPPAKKMKK